MKLTRTIDIAAPPQTVWAIWSDVTRWPQWTAGISCVDVLTPGPFAVGTRVRIRQPKLPPAVWRVTAIDAGRTFTWVSSSPGARVTGTHRVEAHPDGGSRATMSLQFEGPIARLVAWAYRGLIERYLGLEADGLKRRSEARAQ